MRRQAVALRCKVGCASEATGRSAAHRVRGRSAAPHRQGSLRRSQGGGQGIDGTHAGGCRYPVRGGSGDPCHSAMAWAKASDPERVLLLIDVANAFNTVDRSAVRSSFRRFLPRLATWMDVCYGAPSVVLLGDIELSSERGVQQGDPGGPAAFALAIHDSIRLAMETVQRELPGELDWATFYLDDGTIAGTAAAVRRYLTLIAQAFGDIGLEVNMDKCEVAPAAGAASMCAVSISLG